MDSLSIFGNGRTRDEPVFTGCTRCLLGRKPASRRRSSSSSFCQTLFSVKPLMHSADLEVPRLCSHNNSPTAHEPWALWLCSKNACAPMNLIPNDATQSYSAPKWAEVSSFHQLPSLSDLNNNCANRGPTARRWHWRWHLRHHYWDARGRSHDALGVWRSHRAEAFRGSLPGRNGENILMSTANDRHGCKHRNNSSEASC